MSRRWRRHRVRREAAASGARRRQREQQRRPGASAARQRRHDDGGALGVELAEDFGEEPRGVARPVRRVELIPDRRKRRAEIAQEIRQHLAHRLRLARELRQVMPVVNRPLPKPLARMLHPGAVAADDRHGARARSAPRGRGPPSASTPSSTAPSRRTSARGVTVASVVASGANGVGTDRNRRCSSAKRDADRLPGRIPRGVERAHPSAPAAPH